MTVPQIGDIVLRSDDGRWEVFLDTDGHRSIRASTGAPLFGEDGGR